MFEKRCAAAWTVCGLLATTACVTPYDFPWAGPEPTLATVETDVTLTNRYEAIHFNVRLEGPTPQRVDWLIDGNLEASATESDWSFSWTPPHDSWIDQNFEITARAVRDQIPLHDTPESDPVTVRIDRIPPQIVAADSQPRLDQPIQNYWVKRRMEIQVSEQIEVASVSDGAFTVERLSDGAIVFHTVDYIAGGTRVDLTFDQDPQGSETWRVRPQAQLEDLAGNELDLNVASWDVSLPRWVDLDGLGVSNAVRPRLAASTERPSDPAEKEPELHLTWEETDTFFTHVRSHGGIWKSVGGNMGSGVMDALHPMVAVAHTGAPAFIWQEDVELAVRRWNVDNWGPMGNMTVSLPVALDPHAEVLIGKDRAPRIVTTENAQPSLWTFDGMAAWQSDVTSPSVCDSFPDTAVRYTIVTGCSNVGGGIEVASFDGVVWTAAPALTTTNGQEALDVAVAVSGDGVATESALVAWIESDGTLRVAESASGAWNPLGTTETNVDRVSLVADENGGVWRAWERAGALHVDRWSGAAWGSLDEALFVGPGAGESHLVIEAPGRPAIVWTENGSLEVRRYNSR